ncbi:hypothetical protein [Streptomyces chiangmaiensis]|uniref:Uncharacterized protein n=1 Tax=Streptomyces chiangmaiensis TaxID=766497 RepID=A0ABU7FF78_9ACTN|nr:hypothetical protein [Streptomyces chiangmaiensis]MED7822807.1 hypothetical protein [Streptomyces chiangmaiensis]
MLCACLVAGRPPELRGARFAQVALVDGAVGDVVAPRGRLRLVLRVAVEDGGITSYEAIGDPVRLRRLSLTVLDV